MASQYDAMQKYWDGHWSDSQFNSEYATNYYPRRQEEFQTIFRFLPKGGIVLEAGCAYGQVVAYFVDQGYRAVGLDYSPGALAIGRTCLPGLSLVQGDIHSVPYRDNSLDGYVSFGVL